MDKPLQESVQHKQQEWLHNTIWKNQHTSKGETRVGTIRTKKVLRSYARRYFAAYKAGKAMRYKKILLVGQEEEQESGEYGER